MATEIASSQIIHVAGFAGDAHFQKTANIAAALEHLVGSKKLRVRIIEHASAEEFSKWAQEKNWAARFSWNKRGSGCFPFVLQR